MRCNYQGQHYRPIDPQPDTEEFEPMKRLVLYHGRETELFWVKAGASIHSGWIVGVVENHGPNS